MNRPITVIALLLAVIAAIFQLAHIAPEFLPVLILASIVMVCVGVLTGR